MLNDHYRMFEYCNFITNELKHLINEDNVILVSDYVKYFNRDKNKNRRGFINIYSVIPHDLKIQLNLNPDSSGYKPLLIEANYFPKDEYKAPTSAFAKIRYDGNILTLRYELLNPEDYDLINAVDYERDLALSDSIRYTEDEQAYLDFDVCISEYVTNSSLVVEGKIENSVIVCKREHDAVLRKRDLDVKKFINGKTIVFIEE